MALCAGKHEACSAEIGSLAPMFEKSATELKLKQKLLRYKRIVLIVTLNVRTLNRIGQLSELTESVTEHNIDRLSIQEHRYYQYQSRNKIHQYWQWMDIYLSICMEKLCQCCHRECRNASQSMPSETSK